MVWLPLPLSFTVQEATGVALPFPGGSTSTAVPSGQEMVATPERGLRETVQLPGDSPHCAPTSDSKGTTSSNRRMDDLLQGFEAGNEAGRKSP
jgi:hypothetical protein